MATLTLLDLASELKANIFEFCTTTALIRLSLTCKTLRKSVSEELDQRRKWDILDVSRDCGMGPDSRFQFEPHYDHNDCRCKRQHPLPMIHEVLKHPITSRCVTKLHVDEYGLSRVDEEIHNSGRVNRRKRPTSDFFDGDLEQQLYCLWQLDQQKFDDAWSDVMKFHNEETTVLLILIYFLPRLENLTLWSTRRWGSKLLVPLERMFTELLHRNQLSRVLFPNLVTVTVGNPNMHTDQATETFSLMALFAALPTVRTLRGHAVEEGTALLQYGWLDLKLAKSASNVSTLELYAPLISTDNLKACLGGLPLLQTLIYRSAPGDHQANLETVLKTILQERQGYLEDLTLSTLEGQQFIPNELRSGASFPMNFKLRSLTMNAAMFWKFGRAWTREKFAIGYTHDDMSVLREAPRRLHQVIPKFVETLVLEGDMSPAEMSSLVWDIKFFRENLPRLRAIWVTEIDIEAQAGRQELRICVDICSSVGIKLEWTQWHAEDHLDLRGLDFS